MSWMQETFWQKILGRCGVLELSCYNLSVLAHAQETITNICRSISARFGLTLSHDNAHCPQSQPQHGIRHSGTTTQDQLSGKPTCGKPVCISATAVSAAVQGNDPELELSIASKWSAVSGCARPRLHSEATRVTQHPLPSLSSQLLIKNQKAILSADTIEADCVRSHKNSVPEESLAAKSLPRRLRSHRDLPSAAMTRASLQHRAASCLPCDHATAVNAQAARRRYALRPPLACPKSNQDARVYERCRLPNDCTSILQQAFAQEKVEPGRFCLHATCEAIDKASKAMCAQTGTKAKHAPCKHALKRTIAQTLSRDKGLHDCTPCPNRKWRRVVI